ncbi:Bacterial type II secretion system protein F domain protein [Planctomycetes bacterium CA13]|uniref:Bacterial type II secretion system protein F domain protein n=1 Tax=Novipirellula herctigrandis TaxID=2527986 RepID=A0A5C5Z9D3_9BACT|nr:Bacterial type II secretion system protein F domain protein [Planctomycetes bacterium CA13]
MRKIYTGIAYAVAVLLVLFLLPSLFSLIIAILFASAIIDFRYRRRGHYVRMMNSAIRTVAGQDKGLEKVVSSFARSGPMRWQCYEYAQRLRAGQEPLQAAAVSGVPLELSTAIALRIPSSAAQQTQESKTSRRDYRDEFYSADTTTFPLYGQFIYLVLTALITLSVFKFMTVFITPTIEKMLEEFGMATSEYRWLLSGPWISWGLLVLVALMLVVIPVFSTGRFLGIFMPLLPRFAERKSERLRGLADAIEAGFPVEKVFAIGQSISTKANERAEFQRALIRVEQGATPVAAMQKCGWINGQDAQWLANASPQRTAELLRSIADQDRRDASANARWFMELFFPAVILVIGALVMMYVTGFFLSLTDLIRGLA